MRSLLLRIFFSFWLIITLTIVLAAALGYSYAERARSAMQNFQVSEALLEASGALRDSGHQGLVDWLAGLPEVAASSVFILDDSGADLLGRRLPAPVRLAMRQFGRPQFERPPRRNLRPARPFTQLEGPDGRIYTVFVLPPQRAAGRWLAERGRLTLVLLAVLVSAIVSYLLARAISRPIGQLRQSAVSLAGGNLAARVPSRVTQRGDEIGLLGRDFDRMASQLERAWGRQTELTRNVSHELRSPLARLRIALELARRKAGDLPEFDRIDLETERLNSMIGQILEFSRLAAAPDDESQPVDLADLVASVVADVRYEYQTLGRRARLQFEATEPCSVEGFPGVLRSAIENVIRNALQHGDGNEPVTVQLRSDDAGALVTVTDDGGGVAEEDLERIFEPFFRSGSEHSRVGSGLGLAIASRAMAMHGGSIKVKNTGGGLQLDLRLPLTSA